jgi:hypothetical protein
MSAMNCDVAYVVQADDGTLVKVGVSGNPRARVYQIAQSVPFPMRLVALVADGKQSERKMKEILSPWKVRGEWFQPRQELNDFLAQKRRENKLLTFLDVDDEYCENYIKPAVLEYLNGRNCSMTDAGDLVYRFLREGRKVIEGRIDKLHTATKREVSAELLRGFVTLPQGSTTPFVLTGAATEVAA